MEIQKRYKITNGELLKLEVKKALLGKWYKPLMQETYRLGVTENNIHRYIRDWRISNTALKSLIENSVDVSRCVEW